ncbi:hypothetical protein J6590_065391 [Homalodisca vitripennis]|nr:hypothetical protein J6590_065391 [Homalodisca vitripennis]
MRILEAHRVSQECCILQDISQTFEPPPKLSRWVACKNRITHLPPIQAAAVSIILRQLPYRGHTLVQYQLFDLEVFLWNSERTNRLEEKPIVKADSKVSSGSPWPFSRVALSVKSRHSNDNTLAVCGWGRGGVNLGVADRSLQENMFSF